MSSTNRSNARDNHIADYYITPIKDIEKFIKEIIKVEPNIFDGKILDCCAGGDHDNYMSYPKALDNSGFTNVDTIDIREDSKANIKTDYLKYDCKNKFDCIITNPPFNISLDIIKKALDDVKDNGFVIMLLRLNYFGGKVRKEFWDNNLAKYAYVHSKRMSFTGGNKTDSIEYMHCVWQKGIKNDYVRLNII